MALTVGSRIRVSNPLPMRPGVPSPEGYSGVVLTVGEIEDIHRMLSLIAGVNIPYEATHFIAVELDGLPVPEIVDASHWTFLGTELEEVAQEEQAA